jgi:hypothetical protein
MAFVGHTGTQRKTPWPMRTCNGRTQPHDRIEEVLEMYPELRNLTEGIALRQDLHASRERPCPQCPLEVPLKRNYLRASP